MLAHIYSPAKSAAQSGQAQSGRWVLCYEPQSPKWIEPLMGYISTADTQAEVKLRFNSKEEAVAFAQKNAIAYYITEPLPAVRQKLAYSDNFRADRKQPWTH